MVGDAQPCSLPPVRGKARMGEVSALYQSSGAQFSIGPATVSPIMVQQLLECQAHGGRQAPASSAPPYLPSEALRVTTPGCQYHHTVLFSTG